LSSSSGWKFTLLFDQKKITNKCDEKAGKCVEDSGSTQAQYQWKHDRTASPAALGISAGAGEQTCPLAVSGDGDARPRQLTTGMGRVRAAPGSKAPQSSPKPGGRR